jgi:hypothetical protein
MLGGLQQVFHGGLPWPGTTLGLRKFQDEAARIMQRRKLTSAGKRNRLLEGCGPGQTYTSRRANCRSRPA